MKELEIEKLIARLHYDFKMRISKSINVSQKDDQSLVTDIDNSFSQIVKEWCQEFKDHLNFYSEEDYSELTFPSCILDPIDGTKELVKGVPECCLSMALMEDSILNSSKNSAVIYNPFTGFLTTSFDKLVVPQSSYHQEMNRKLLCFVSRTEYKEKLFSNVKSDDLEIYPKGSIALKLGFLANRICDVVISLKPKNVWDIAAGTILCDQRNIAFFEQGKRVLRLDKVKYEPPLVWTSVENWKNHDLKC